MFNRRFFYLEKKKELIEQEKKEIKEIEEDSDMDPYQKELK